MVRYYLDTLNALELAVGNQCVVEINVVQGFGVDHADAVKAFLGSIDSHAVGRIANIAEEVELFGNNTSLPAYRYPFEGSGVVVEQYLVGFDIGNLARAG